MAKTVTEGGGSGQPRLRRKGFEDGSYVAKGKVSGMKVTERHGNRSEPERTYSRKGDVRMRTISAKDAKRIKAAKVAKNVKTTMLRKGVQK
jgi:hypothetical protein